MLYIADAANKMYHVHAHQHSFFFRDIRVGKKITQISHYKIKALAQEEVRYLHQALPVSKFRTMKCKYYLLIIITGFNVGLSNAQWTYDNASINNNHVNFALNHSKTITVNGSIMNLSIIVIIASEFEATLHINNGQFDISY